MKILFDHQIFVYQNYGGISRYFYELITQLKKHNPQRTIFLRYFSENAYIKAAENSKIPFSILNGKFPGRMTLYNLLNKTISKIIIKKQSFDIFHPTYYDDYYLNIIGNKPFVITIYDMIHELYPGFWPDQTNIVERKSKLMFAATGIIAISQNTKNDILKLYPSISESKIKVIYLANSLTKKYNKINTKTNTKYLLFVGIRSNYKNFNNLLIAFKSISKIHIDLQLICAGGGAFTKDEINEIQNLNLNNKISFLPIKDDAFLIELYTNAELFVFPSLYEGFGIPILEAFSMNCPVVLSKSSCFWEIAEDAAEYFDGNNPNDISITICNLLNNPKRLNELKILGEERIKKFTWEKTTIDTLLYYKEVIEKMKQN